MRISMFGRTNSLVYAAGAFLFGMSSVDSAEKRASDANGLETAAEIVLSQKAAMDVFRERCVAGARDQTQYVKAAVFFWLSENSDPVYAADQVATEAKKRSHVLPSFDVSAVECLPFAKSIFDGEQNVRHTTPKAFDYLRRYLATHPIPEAEWAERETRVGCMKSGLNRGQDFDRLSRHCECVGRTFVQATTPSERKEYWEAVSDKDETKTDQLLKKITPKAMTCPAP